MDGKSEGDLRRRKVQRRVTKRGMSRKVQPYLMRAGEKRQTGMAPWAGTNERWWGLHKREVAPHVNVM